MRTVSAAKIGRLRNAERMKCVPYRMRGYVVCMIIVCVPDVGNGLDRPAGANWSDIMEGPIAYFAAGKHTLQTKY